MRKTSYVLFFFLFLFAGLACAFDYNVSYPIVNVHDCVNISIDVNATSVIDDGEYVLNCGNNLNNTWSCNCSGDYVLDFNVSERAVNNYSIDVDYTYAVYSGSGGGGGGGGSCKKPKIIEESLNITVDKAAPIVKPVVPKPVEHDSVKNQGWASGVPVVPKLKEPVPELVVEQSPPSEPANKWLGWLVGAIIVCVLVAGIALYLNNRSKQLDADEDEFEGAK